MADLGERNLDRIALENAIPTVIKNVLGADYSFEYKKTSPYNCVLSINQIDPPISLAVFYKKNGLTSFNPNVGKNQEYSAIIAQALIDHSEISTIEKINFSINSISDDDFTMVIDIFNDLKNYQVSEKVIPYGKLFQITGPQNDVFSITRYENKNTLFQGKPLIVYKELYALLPQFCSISDLLASHESVYKIQVNKNAVDFDFANRLVNTKRYLDEKLEKIILPSFALKRITIDLSDYSVFLFPIVRGFEGFIRKICKDNGITTGKLLNDYFTNSYDKSMLRIKLDFRKQIGNDDICLLLEKAFDFFAPIRNQMFHVDGAINPAYIVETRSDADEIFDSFISKFEEISSLLP